MLVEDQSPPCQSKDSDAPVFAILHRELAIAARQPDTRPQQAFREMHFSSWRNYGRLCKRQRLMIDTTPCNGKLNWVLKYPAPFHFMRVPILRICFSISNVRVASNVRMSTTTTQLEHGISERYELSDHSPRLSSNQQQVLDNETPPETKSDRQTYLKLISVAFSFFVAGVNDGSIGALVPYIIRDYGVNTAIVSSVYVPNIPH